VIRIGRIQGVPIAVHWSVAAIAAIILVANWRDLPLAVAAGGSYLGVLAIHELGHAFVARRQRCRVLSISLYPIHGVCRYEDAGSDRRNGLIAWGGVLAQAVVAMPLLVYLALFGYTPIPAANAAIVILGIFSSGWALFNLLPFPPLDGARAWSVLRSGRPRRPRRRKPVDRKGLRVVR
jgi:Zn-dependent protease